jgi:mono/diheme cytochrome c family protein
VIALSCTPKDSIPFGSAHPADPAAPKGAGAPKAVEPGPADGGGHEGHDATGGHEGHGAGAAATPSRAPTDPDLVSIAAAEEASFARAKPVFQKYCASCHSKAGKKATRATLGHFSIDTYPFGGHHAAEVGETVREVLGVTGEKPTMPKHKPGVVQGEDLAAIVEWSKAFDASHAAGLHDHGAKDHGHHHGGH